MPSALDVLQVVAESEVLQPALLLLHLLPTPVDVLLVVEQRRSQASTSPLEAETPLPLVAVVEESQLEADVVAEVQAMVVVVASPLPFQDHVDAAVEVEAAVVVVASQLVAVALVAEAANQLPPPQVVVDIAEVPLVNVVTDGVEVPLPSLPDQEVVVVKKEANPLELVDAVKVVASLSLAPVDEPVVEVEAVVVAALVVEADPSSETKLAAFCLPRVLEAKVAVVELKDAVQPADVVVERRYLLPSEATVKVVVAVDQAASPLPAVGVDLKKEVPAALVEPQKAVLVVARSFQKERASPMLCSLFPCSLFKSL